MTVEIKVPQLPESVADATIATWYKKPGDTVKRDENLVDIETDKVVLEVVAPQDGVLEKINKETGATVKAEEVIGILAAAGNTAATVNANSEQNTSQSSEVKYAPQTPPNRVTPADTEGEIKSDPQAPVLAVNENLSPSERRALKEHDEKPQEAPSQSIPSSPKNGDSLKPEVPLSSKEQSNSDGRLEKRVPMTRLRSKIAERLLAAQHNAAILTTFNEINMAPVIALRNNYKEEFLQKYNVRLGYMGFFVTAVVAALKRFPVVNASIDGSDVVYHGFFDIGIAVSTERGLVVPVLRDADTLSMPEIEQKIADFGQRAKNGKLTMEELTGGTFTITNGGVYGSLMSTPILNPPQSAILGVHKIEERPVVENKQIVIRPMTYVALSYDHRLIDGAESVQFLVAIKELLEDPARLLLSI